MGAPQSRDQHNEVLRVALQLLHGCEYDHWQAHGVFTRVRDWEGPEGPGHFVGRDRELPLRVLETDEDVAGVAAICCGKCGAVCLFDAAVEGFGV